MMDDLDVRGIVHEQRMTREGMTQCDECGEWADDCVPCVRERNMGDSGTGWAFHDVPQRIGDVCGQCRVDDPRITPEADY